MVTYMATYVLIGMVCALLGMLAVYADMYDNNVSHAYYETMKHTPMVFVALTIAWPVILAMLFIGMLTHD